MYSFFTLSELSGSLAFAVHWLLQSTLLLGAGLIIGRLLRSRGSAVQSAIYRTTLVAMLLCPIATWSLSQAGLSGWSLTNIEGPNDTTIVKIAEPITVPPLPTQSVEILQTSAVPKNGAITPIENPVYTPSARQQVPRFAIAVVVASMISMTLLLRLALAWRRLVRLRKQAVSADSETLALCHELAKTLKVTCPQVLCCPYVPSPCLAGLRRPAILLPEENKNLLIHDVLVHELAHLRRQDGHWNLLRRTTTSLFWFQPLLWKLSSRLEATAEEVCDDFVVQYGANRQEYAHRLVDIAELSSVPIAAAGVGMVSLRSMLAQRVARILDTSRKLSTQVNSRFLALVLAGGLLATLVVGLVGAGSQVSQAESPVSSENVEIADKQEIQLGNSGTNIKKPAEALVASAPASKAEFIEITGTVVDESGNSISNAILLLPLKYDDERMVEATTNRQGRFTLRVPTEWTKPGPFTPAWTVWCYAPGHQLATASAYDQLKWTSKESINITLKPENNTGFVVTDLQEEPIVGAFVEPWHFLGAAYEIVPKRFRKLIGKTTDAKGQALLPSMGRDGFHSVQVNANGYGVQQMRLRDSADEPAIRLVRLRSAGRLEGRLTTDNKAAVESARVFVSQEEIRTGIVRASGQASVTVDAKGRFVIPEFAEGPIKLIIRVNNGLTIRPRIPENLVIVAGATTQVEVPFEQTVLVRGRVQIKEHGDPVAGGLVSVNYGSFRQGEQVRTDAEGRFAVNVLAGPLQQQLIIRPDKYGPWTTEKAGWQNRIQVPEHVETFDLPPIELIETYSRPGRLVDSKKNPIVGARISAITGNRVYAGARTDEKGAFVLQLPQDFSIEKYRIHRTRGALSNDAFIVRDSPLVLQARE